MDIIEKLIEYRRTYIQKQCKEPKYIFIIRKEYEDLVKTNFWVQQNNITPNDNWSIFGMKIIIIDDILLL